MHECPRKEVTFCCITDPRTVILVSVRHGDVFWQRFCDVPGISFLFLSLFFTTTTDIFPSGRLALHGHVSTTNAPVDSGGGEGRGRGYVAFPIWSLSALVRQSDVKRVGVFFSPPSFTTLLQFFSFSHSEVCESLVLPVTLSILFRSSSALKMSIFHFPWNEIRILGVLGWITCLVWQPWPHKGSCFFFFLKVLSSTWR